MALNLLKLEIEIEAFGIIYIKLKKEKTRQQKYEKLA